jgi:hypothetical protein
LCFDRAEEVTAGDGGARGRHPPVVAVLAGLHLQQAFVQVTLERVARVPGGGEVTDAGLVGPLAVLDVVDHLGNDRVEIEIALAVAMGAQVERHALEAGREVGAMVEVEATQEVLVGLAGTRMLSDGGARHHFEQFT